MLAIIRCRIFFFSGLVSKNINIKMHRIIILPVVLYGRETWSLPSREEHRLRVSESRVLRRIFGPKVDKVTGEWRKLHNKEFNDLYFSLTVFRVIKLRMRWVVHVSRMVEMRGVYRVLVGKAEGKRPLGRPRRRWEDNIMMDIQELGGGQGLIFLAQDRDRWRAIVNVVMSPQVP